MTDWTPMKAVKSEGYDLLKAVRELRDAAWELSKIDEAVEHSEFWADVKIAIGRLHDELQAQGDATADIERQRKYWKAEE